MFKSVEYVGFDGRPELKAKAEQATAALGGVIRSWRDEVDVTWRPAPETNPETLELTLALALWNASGSAAGDIRVQGFEPGAELALRADLREVWLNLLGDLSRKQMKRLAEMPLEPAEA